MARYLTTLAILTTSLFVSACTNTPPAAKEEGEDKAVIMRPQIERCDLTKLQSGQTYWASLQGAKKIILSADGTAQCKYQN